MNAGSGAEEQMTRHARRAERLQRELEAARETEAEVAAALERARRQERAWAAGAEGERMVADSLDVLRRYGWTFLHDVHWPGRPFANIDHIGIGPGGVAVIDAKNWSGTVTATDGTLRQNGYGRGRELDGVSAATAAVTALLEPLHRTATIGMLCLASQDQAPAATSAGVPVVGRHQLAAALLDLPLRLSPFEVADIARYLARELGEDRPAKVTGSSASRRARSTSSGPLNDDPSPRPIRSPGQPSRDSSAARRPTGGRPAHRPTGRGSRPAARRGSTSTAGALLRLALVIVGLGVLMSNADSIGDTAARLLVPDVVSTQPAPVPPAEPTTPEPAGPAPADPAPATIVP
jgi:Nuclease-related domain